MLGYVAFHMPNDSMTKTFLSLFSRCLAVPILPVAIPLIVDLSGGNDPGDDIVVRRGEDPSL